MTQLKRLLAWTAAVIMAVLLILNWPTLMASAPLDLLVVQIQAPTGIVMLGLAGALATLMFFAYLSNRIRALVETHRLLSENLRLHNLAENAATSRVSEMHERMISEFAMLNQRLSTKLAQTEAMAQSAEFKPYSLTEIISDHERALK